MSLCFGVWGGFQLRNKISRKKILVIHGPNVNLLGFRETSIYGKESISSINQQITEKAHMLGVDCVVFQSNSEGSIIDAIQQAREEVDGIIINAGAYTHYSIAIRDAIAAIHIPCIEVHCSNIYNREDFRSKSVITPVCAGSIVGFGKHSYFLAISAIKDLI